MNGVDLSDEDVEFIKNQCNSKNTQKGPACLVEGFDIDYKEALQFIGIEFQDGNSTAQKWAVRSP